MVRVAGGSHYEVITNFHFTREEGILIYTLLFFGFGFKFPIWPFHYWLTKTHVEASSGFSIYLSGFLVKSALFGFFTLTNLLKVEFQTTVFGVIAFLGSIDASLKM
jgi:NADH:ubiquinone oxidoreductase subunit 4 (subunit M)